MNEDDMKIIASLIDEAIVMKDNESAQKEVANKVHKLMSDRPLFV
jgi:glycine/serine hydroxymethyltransferase